MVIIIMDFSVLKRKRCLCLSECNVFCGRDGLPSRASFASDTFRAMEIVKPWNQCNRSTFYFFKHELDKLIIRLSYVGEVLSMSDAQGWKPFALLLLLLFVKASIK